MERESQILDAYGKPMLVMNGTKPPEPKPRQELIEAFNATNGRKMRGNYDAARNTVEFQKYAANFDALDADSANSKAVRQRLRDFSRYEEGSSGYYNGMLETHVNMAVGVGPTLRMLTKDKNFNQFVEREFYKWAQQIQLRRKLWCMGHARYQDGEAFGILQTNPGFLATNNRAVSLDVAPIEADQVTTPFLPFRARGYIDGISFDEFNNIQWYDVLPEHPGNMNQFLNTTKPIRVYPPSMLHWFKLKRPAAHRGIPAMTSTLNLGASSRRMREATLAAAETAADFSLILETNGVPDSFEGVRPLSSFEIYKRMMVVAPDGYKASQLRADHPNQTYDTFNKSNIGEQGRPLSMPYNLSACDSSQYSFASGKLDMLCYWLVVDIERQDCNDLVLDPLFQEWFREWSLAGMRPEGPPVHQWDWPAKPVIDSVAEAQATDTKLQNGTTTIRDVYTAQSQDFEDQLMVMAEDTFGEATDETIAKMRQIVTLKNSPPHAIEFVANIIGAPLPEPQQKKQSAPASVSSQLAKLSQAQLRELKKQLESLETSA